MQGVEPQFPRTPAIQDFFRKLPVRINQHNSAAGDHLLSYQVEQKRRLPATGLPDGQQMPPQVIHVDSKLISLLSVRSACC